MNMHNTEKGFVAILTVLTLMAVSLSLVIAVSILSVDESESSLALSKSESAYQLTSGCIEDMLLQSRLDENYSGGNMVHPEGDCTVSISKDGIVWTADVQGTDGVYSRSSHIIFERNIDSVAVLSWKEI